MCTGVSLDRVGVELVDLFVRNPLEDRPVFQQRCLCGLISQPAF